MNNWQLALIALFSLDSLALVLTIGKERIPHTPAYAALLILCNALVVFMVVHA